MDELNNIKKVEPSEFLFNRIQNRITELKENEIAMPKIYAIAASFALIVSMNMGTVLYKNAHKSQKLSIQISNNFYNE